MDGTAKGQFRCFMAGSIEKRTLGTSDSLQYGKLESYKLN